MKPEAKTYSLPVALSQLTNSDALAKLTPAQKKRLSELGFVVIPDTAAQMFFLYEGYPSDTAQPVPNFITVDSLLHAYHLFFDFALRTIETKHLVAAAELLSRLELFQSGKFYQQLPPGPLREATARNAAYFAVALSLLTGETVPTGVSPEMDNLVKAELGLIKAHAGRALSPLFGTSLEYSQFVPRGHYTRSDALQKYFRAMMWYGLVGFQLDTVPKHPGIAAQQTRQALLITKILAGDGHCRDLWLKIYEPTAFFVGASDDLGYERYLGLARKTFGPDLPLAAMADEARFDKFLTQARATMPAPRIAPYFEQATAGGALIPRSATVQKRQFRFMGQRFIPDAYALQQLVSPLVKPASPTDARDMPMGLDVAAALGSDRALSLLLNEYNQGRYPGYRQQMTKVRTEFATLTEAQWWHNLYWGWLYSLKGLLGAFGQGYPAFMRTPQWQDKELQTALGSWSQLRHDTVLYGKPSGAEMGGAEPTAVRGYVEPVPEVWGRLAYLVHISRAGLAQRQLLDPQLAQAYTKLEDLLLFLKQCADKELAGKLLSHEAYDRIQFFGGELERLQLSTVQGNGASPISYWFEISNDTDRNMAAITDVHTSFDQALEVGVGPAYRLYVVVPRGDGRLQVAKGGVFSYYEFKWPVSNRLTDEKWQEMLKARQAPPQPDWTSSFILGPAYPQAAN